MGRKFKMSFSSSDKDTGLSIYMIWVLFKNCKRCKRFQSNVRRRLGSVMPIADRVYSGNQIIPTTEGILKF
jgi:sulfite reductase (ferredoxin)